MQGGAREGRGSGLSVPVPVSRVHVWLPSGSEAVASALLARQEQSEAGGGRPVHQGDQRPSGRKAACSPSGPCFPGSPAGFGFQKAPLANSPALSQAEHIYKALRQNWGRTWPG